METKNIYRAYIHRTDGKHVYIIEFSEDDLKLIDSALSQLVYFTGHSQRMRLRDQQFTPCSVSQSYKCNSLRVIAYCEEKDVDQNDNINTKSQSVIMRPFEMLINADSVADTIIKVVSR